MDLSLKENHLQLKSLLSENADRVAGFIGAGCSAILNIPLWDDLLIELNNNFKYYPSKEALVNSIAVDGHSKVASNIKSAAVNSNEKYYEILDKTTKQRSCYYSSLHISLVRLFKTLLTTNYDNSLELALDNLKEINNNYNYVKQTAGKIDLFGLGTQRNIFHLHGDNDNHNFVLTYETYEEQYKNTASGVATLIREVFKSFNIVFIGFSFNDSFFVKFLENSESIIHKEKILVNGAHFCIYSDDILKKTFTPTELIDQFRLNITTLLAENILVETQESNPKEFYFNTATAEMISNNQSIDDEQKKIIIGLIKKIENNQEKIELFRRLNINLITYDKADHIRIEDILKELSSAKEFYADTYVE